MPNNVGEISRCVTGTPTQVLSAASEYFRQQGRVLDQSAFEVTGVVGGGHLNLNSVHVTVQGQPAVESQTEFVARAVAKEGVSKQYAGEKTASLIVEYIVLAVAGDVDQKVILGDE